MKRLRSGQFEKPRCVICKHFIRQDRKNGPVPHCKLYRKDVPGGGTIYPLWCKDKFERTGVSV